MNARRWFIAFAGFLLQVVLGSAYAWSVFRTPLMKQFGWNITDASLTFTICIGVLSVAAFLGGLWQAKSGPRVVAVTGAILYGVGVALASTTTSLSTLYWTYGVIGGIGNGLAYIIPVAVLVKWFPDRRGLITGVAVGGFGVGALIVAPLATSMIASSGVLHTFFVLGVAYAVIGAIAAFFMVNPPAGWQPAGWTPSAAVKKSREGGDFTLGGAVATWQWWALWLILFLNTSAGISLVSQEAPVYREFIPGSTAAQAAVFVSIVSIGNAAGRIFWSMLSDGIGRKLTFIIMYLLQAVFFFLLPSMHSPALLCIVGFFILLIYGGGFGTMPAFAADYYGAKNYGSIYGLMLTAWGAASAFGPLLVAHYHQQSGNFVSGFHILAGIVLISTIVPIIVRKPTGQAA